MKSQSLLKAQLDSIERDGGQMLFCGVRVASIDDGMNEKGVITKVGGEFVGEDGKAITENPSIPFLDRLQFVDNGGNRVARPQIIPAVNYIYGPMV